MSGVNVRRGNSTRRNRLLRRLRAEQRPCWICGLPIDYGAPAGNPLAFECDELVPVSRGGSPYDPANVDAAHRCCNNWRGAKPVPRVRAIVAACADRFGTHTSAQAFVERAKAVERGPACGPAREQAQTTTAW